jgi:hypothetical protein
MAVTSAFSLSREVKWRRAFDAYDTWAIFAETSVKAEQRAEKYRTTAAEIRTISTFLTVEDVRASLLNLAIAYERLADAAEFDLVDHLSPARDSQSAVR